MKCHFCQNSDYSPNSYGEHMFSCDKCPYEVLTFFTDGLVDWVRIVYVIDDAPYLMEFNPQYNDMWVLKPYIRQNHLDYDVSNFEMFFERKRPHDLSVDSGYILIQKYLNLKAFL